MKLTKIGVKEGRVSSSSYGDDNDDNDDVCMLMMKSKEKDDIEDSIVNFELMEGKFEKKRKAKESILALIPEEIWIEHICPYLIGNHYGGYRHSDQGRKSIFSLVKNDELCLFKQLSQLDSRAIVNRDGIDRYGMYGSYTNDLLQLSLTSKEIYSIIKKCQVKCLLTIHPNKLSLNIQDGGDSVHGMNKASALGTGCSSSRNKNDIFEMDNGDVNDENNEHNHMTNHNQKRIGSIHGFRIRPSWWSHIGFTFEDALQSLFPESYQVYDNQCINVVSDSTNASIKSKIRYKIYECEKNMQMRKTLLSQVNLYELINYKIRHLKIEDVIVTKDDINIISQFDSVVSFQLPSRTLPFGIDQFPPHISGLIVSNCTHVETENHSNLIRIENIPKTIRYLDIDSNCLLSPTLSGRTIGNVEHLFLRQGPISLYVIKSFPQSIKSLKLFQLSFPDGLIHLPPKLSDLEILFCSDLNGEIKSLPQGLKNLRIDRCNAVSSIVLPASIKNVRCFGNHSLISIRALGKLEYLERFEVNYCNINIQLPTSEFPLKMKSFKLVNHDIFPFYQQEIKNYDIEIFSIEHILKMRSISMFPKMVKTIELSKLSNIREISVSLPESITTLKISDCKDLLSVPALPNALKCLQLSFLNIKDIPNLPNELEHFHLEGCHQIYTIDKLPTKIDTVRLLNLENLKSVSISKELTLLSLLEIKMCGILHVNFDFLPESLQHLVLCNNRCLGNHIGWLPPKLQTLSIDNLKYSKYGFQHLPERLPSTLKTLALRGASNLVRFPRLPTGLTALELKDCKQLRYIADSSESKRYEGKIGIPSNLPESLRVMRIVNCPNLEFIENIPKNLLVCGLIGTNPVVSMFPIKTECFFKTY